MSNQSHLEQRRARDVFMKEHYASPLPEEEQAVFKGLDYFPPDPAWRLPARFRATDAIGTEIPTTSGHDAEYTKVGTASVTIGVTTYELSVFDDGDGGRFIPFRDGTSGSDSYGGGRYVDVEETADGAVVDFNGSKNPWCVYDPEFVCPLPPRENWIEEHIEAGEKMFTPRASGTN